MSALSQRVVAEALRDLPDRLTMGDLVDEFNRSDFKENFRSLSVAEFVAAAKGENGGGASARPARGAKAPAASAAGGKSRRGKTWRTRTEAGRKAFDQAMRGLLEAEGTLGAEAIRKRIGGSADQIRKSLARLGELGLVKRAGIKRATVYTFVSGGRAPAAAGKKKKKAGKKKTAKKKARRTR